jgi:SEC-C motif
VAVARNAPCPCGSGRKYKRCCLAEEQRAAHAARCDDAVGDRIQAWAAELYGEEIDAAIEEYGAPERTFDEVEMQIFSTWFHNDRELPGGGAPAERYATRADLPAEERETAARIAAAELGLHRVLAVEPGSWIELEGVVDGARTRVRSASVSRDAVRWDILLGRVMTGEPRSLWGPVRLFAPDDEPELLAELRRLTGAEGEDVAAKAELDAAFRECALELMRFRPPRWNVARSFFTPEGDPLAHGQATWRVTEPARARERFRALGGLAPGDTLEIDLTVRRDRLLAKERPPLPEGALVIETERVGDDENVPVATVRLEGGELQVEAMSAARIELAIEAVETDFGDIAELVGQDVTPIEQRLDEHRESDPQEVDEVVPSPPLAPVDEERLLSDFAAKHLRRWLDEPLPALGGETPRAAAGGERRGEVIRLVRGIENRADRDRRHGKPAADVAWLRAELAIDDELAA